MRRAHWLRYLCAPIARSPLSVSPIHPCVFLCRQWNKVVLAFITRVHVCVCAVVFMPWALGLGAHTHMEHNTLFGCPARAAVRAAVHLACQSVVALIGWTVLRLRLTDSAQTHSPSRSSASDQQQPQLQQHLLPPLRKCCLHHFGDWHFEILRNSFPASSSIVPLFGCYWCQPASHMNFGMKLHGWWHIFCIHNATFSRNKCGSCACALACFAAWCSRKSKKGKCKAES